MKKALIIGAGSYVIGDSFGIGVILPSLLELGKKKQIDEIKIAVRSKRKSDFWERVRKQQYEIASFTPVTEYLINSPNDLNKLDLFNYVVFIAVPDFSHYEYLNYLVEHNIPTWIVKPLTGDGQKSYKISKIAYDKKVPVWVDYHKRFDPSNRKLKKIISDNQFGHLHLYSVQYSQPIDIPLSDLAAWAKHIDVFQYIGCHYVDQIFYLFPNCVPVRVSATGFEGYLKSQGGPRYDLINAIIDFQLPSQKIIRGLFAVGWNDPMGSQSKSHQRIDLQFEKGRIIAEQKNRGFQIWNSEKTEEVNPNFFQLFPSFDNQGSSPMGYGFDSIQYFIELLNEPDKFYLNNLPWAWFSFQTDYIIDATKKSLDKQGEWISIAQIPDLLKIST